MFRGYSGYVQADAKSVYDVLFREPDKPPPDDAETADTEVGCWSHCRRKFWEATCAKSEVAREGLARIGRIFALEDAWRADPPEVILRLRRQHLRPHLDASSPGPRREYQEVREQRGLLRSALGYAVRQKDALMRVLDDGRLGPREQPVGARAAPHRRRPQGLALRRQRRPRRPAPATSSRSSPRRGCTGSTPRRYLRDLFRVLAHWPRDRYLELAPKYWAATRARLDARELAAEIGPLTVPPPLTPAAQEQAVTDGPT